MRLGRGRQTTFSALIIGVALVPGSNWALSRAALRHALPLSQPNANTTPAGRLHDGVLDLELLAALTLWHPDGDSMPGIPVEAFSEPGKAPQVPGPLIRYPALRAIRVGY
jgi:hypothetical protein